MDELARRLARGERAAFAELYDQIADALHHYLTVRLGTRTDADDVLQETFVRLALNRDKLAAVDNLRAYAFTVARHESARRLASRGLWRRQRREIEAADLYCVAENDPLLERELAEAVAAALARLDTAEREVVELKTFAGLTLKEIAQITGAPQGTVAWRYRAALERLRHCLRKTRDE